jgi:hypothetical protein
MTLFAALAIPVQLAAQEHTTHFRHYKLIDIGTFGGPASYINPPFTFGSHNQINQRGTIVGGAATSIPTSPTSDFLCVVDSTDLCHLSITHSNGKTVA